MKLFVNNTGSAGNNYYVTDSEGNSLIIDAGVKPNMAKIGNPEGLLISHMHGDHFQYHAYYLNFANFIKIQDFETVETKSFIIKAFPMLHFKDGEHTQHIDCQSFLIKSKVDKKILYFATDFFYRKQPDYYNVMFLMLQQINIDLIAVECNHNDMLMHTIKDIPNAYRKSSQNHISDNEFVQFLLGFVNKNKVNNILTLHGSNRFSIDREVKKTIEKTFKNSIVQIAKNKTEYKF